MYQEENLSRDPEELSSDIMDLRTESLCETEDQEYTDTYLNSRCESESEDGDQSTSETIALEDTESHYITTHEIQLSELDHDVDHELGRTASSCWDYEDDNLVYSFVDYASFKSDKTSERRSNRGLKPGISTESDCYESDEGGRNARGCIHVSIKSSSRTVNSVRPPSVEKDVLHQYSSEERKIDRPYDIHSHCFIPAPGRQHLASKLKGKDMTEYSSGASSSVSELDDADKEVRNLTAKSFRSLACPYFDTIDLRPSSESSVSEHGLNMNRWSTFVDFNYRNYITQGGERKNSTCSLEMRKHAECENKTINVTTIAEARTLQSNILYTKSKPVHTNSSIISHPRADFLTARERRAKCLREGSTSSCEAMNQPCGAVFASSLLKNVISKKMKFEQECKMERGEDRDVCHGPSIHQDGSCDVNLQRQTSETGSEHSVVSVEERNDTTDVCKVEMQENICNQPENNNNTISVPLVDESETSEINICQESEHTGFDTTPDITECAGVAVNLATKMSHLYVPGSHFLPKDKNISEFMSNTSTSQTDERKTPGITDASKKPPEIMIRLHSVNESKAVRPFNIASLLTPNLTKHTVVDSKTHLSEKTPHFTVRDVRDSRCKLQTPIHQVRDVRKLVKSSYRFVSLKSGENKNGLFTLREVIDTVKKEPDKIDKKDEKAAPMVIKCQSVNTNSGNKSYNQDNERSSPKSVLKQHPGEQLDIQTKTNRWKVDKCVDGGEKKPEFNFTNQVALEKLKAAVKTMEQLYVFDRNEWRRKTEAPRPVNSHVLSLIAKEEQGVSVISENPASREPIKTSEQNASIRTMINPQQGSNSFLQSDVADLASTVQISSSDIIDYKNVPVGTSAGTKTQQLPVFESENYLTIPIKSQSQEMKHPQELSFATQPPRPHPQAHLQTQDSLRRSPVIPESWSSKNSTLTFCKSANPTGQILCVTPPMDQPAPNTQRKLLLDPMTGQCYLVDTPVTLQPITQRLISPEGARYLDVPVPLAVSPAAYVICPPAVVSPHSPSMFSEGETASAGASTGVGTVMGGAKPVISITSQQGPRIVAPPSFDGTTMSFVVEHR